MHQLQTTTPPFHRLRSMLRLESRELWVTVVYSASIGLISLAVPVAVQAVVNTVAFGTLIQPLVVLTLLAFGALCFSVVLHAGRMWVVELIQRRVFVRLAGEVTSKLVHVAPAALQTHHGPELVNRFLDVVTVQKAGASLLIDGLSVLMQSVIGMILLAVYHPWLLAFDVLLLAAIGFILFPLGSGAVATSMKESKAKYALVAWMEEVARHPLGFKTRAGETLAIGRTNDLVVQYLGYRGAHFRILMRQVTGSFVLQAIASAALLGVGGWLVIQRQLTLGQLVAAEIVVALVVSGFTKFGKHLESFYDLMAAVDKLGYLTDLPVERAGGALLPRSAKPAELRIAGIQIPAGERVALTGQTGSGKSTLVDTFYGMSTVATQRVEIDGLDLREIQLGDLRSQVALVRMPEIFEGSILENLRLGNEQLSVLEARRVLDAVGLLERVTAFPQGLETTLSTGGAPLSHGQRIQLELARALAQQPRLLILDECLDRLDDLPQRGELLDFLFRKDAPWTIVAVTQSPEIIQRCGRQLNVREHIVSEVA
ncbi:MAG: ATP-binding cassette domain-containing protein [Acidobacteria bacterium]|nr:ATP-binding cassette domain-containing protein [Acidobacteriota bacterium]